MLAGFTALTIGVTLTLSAAAELQFQQRELTTRAEGLALIVAEAGTKAGIPATDSQRLTELAKGLLIVVDTPGRSRLVVQANSLDGQTFKVRLCDTVHAWLLPWLGVTSAGRIVCGEGLARNV